MVEMQTMTRTGVEIDGSSMLLAQGQDLDELKRRFEAAAATTGTFVDFVVVGNRRVSVMISSNSRIVMSTAAVQFDPRDDGDDSAPFGGFYDDF